MTFVIWNVKTEKGLECHDGKKHKLSLSPIPHMYGHTEECEGTISLKPTEEYSLDKKYNHPPALVIHPVREQFCYKFSNGEIW